METILISPEKLSELLKTTLLQVIKESSGRLFSDSPMTVEDAAQFLNLEPGTIYTLYGKGLLPGYKKTARLYFLKDDLLAYLKSGKNKN